MRTESSNQAFASTSRPRTVAGAARRPYRPRIASTSSYMAVAGATAAALFFTLWWMLHLNGDESPWVPAGLAASVVMLVALAAREVVVRRAWTRYVLEQNKPNAKVRSADKLRVDGGGQRSLSAYASILRSLQKQSAEADAAPLLPNLHLDLYHSCREYLASVDDALRHNGISGQGRVTLRAGQQRVRALQKRHLLLWASGSSRSLTFEAQKRVLMSDKVEWAMRALDVIDSALKIYPDETELQLSATAVREYVASVKVAHWIELAERAAFKGKYRRAIDYYHDALFYLLRESTNEATRDENATRIGREIELLRARLKTGRPERKKPEPQSESIKG